LQEQGAESERDAGARRRGGAMLDELRALQADLLRGAADPARLARLARLAEGETGADPGLREAVAGIALRARVELARLGLAASPSRN
jgi:Class II flagellar assembly regulator